MRVGLFRTEDGTTPNAKATLRFLSKTASEGGILAMRVAVDSTLLLESETAAVPDRTLGLKKLSVDSSARRSASSLALSIFSIEILGEHRQILYISL